MWCEITQLCRAFYLEPILHKLALTLFSLDYVWSRTGAIWHAQYIQLCRAFYLEPPEPKSLDGAEHEESPAALERLSKRSRSDAGSPAAGGRGHAADSSTPGVLRRESEGLRANRLGV